MGSGMAISHPPVGAIERRCSGERPSPSMWLWQSVVAELTRASVFVAGGSMAVVLVGYIDLPNGSGQLQEVDAETDRTALCDFLYPSKELLPEDKVMSIFDHLEELHWRIFISALAVGSLILGCFAILKGINHSS
ncbi:hypothetical protein Dimus_033745 [Dionaea muscipula]